ncbi:transferrin-like isoform X2 [Photinus pyralis]|uniref:Transferrin-like domain-containing protein n=1 Tax=Photinus pyralis TaxID=7054 RepID=A0A1Y1K3F2_PHOPY|nr:transferrin-like isoform X2 [Photinus pyralis]
MCAIRHTNLKRGNMGVCRVLVLLFLTLCEVYSRDPYSICASLKDKSDCDQVERQDFVRCQYSLHNVDCLLNIENKRADFGTVQPEAALVGAKFLKNVVVVGEFRTDTELDDSEFAVVVLVRKTHTGGLKNLRGKKYCHPGFKFNHIVTDFVLKEFENTVLKENNAEGCKNKVSTATLLEKEIRAVSEFFGPSCRPGPWFGFEKFDNEFYKNYSNLCELCKENDCKAGNVPFTDSINCLLNGGDVAVTTMHTVYQYFNSTEYKNRIDEFAYLCKNGEVRGLDNPCAWSKQPWNLIVVNKEKESVIKSDIQSWFANNIINTNSNIEPVNADTKNIQPILFPTDQEYNKIQIVAEAPTLLEYIAKYREIPSTEEKCGENIRWCTVSNAEQQKCEWLAQASANVAIQPTIKCIQSPTPFACLEDIKIGGVDVVASDAHLGYIARKKDLAPLAFPDTASKDRIKPIIVLRNDNNSINSLADLKGKKACIPDYGGIEWLSFINTARAQGVISHSSCDYGKLISDFVSESCMPGAHDKEHEVSGNIDVEKLCKLCQPDPQESKTGVNCNSNTENRFYGHVGALKCLKEAGEFAVVTQEDYSEFNPNDFRVLCKNGSLAAAPGFIVDENCALTKIIDSEVLAKKDGSKVGNINAVLLNLETRFGSDRHKFFEVFNSFNNTLDLLFKDSTQGLSYLQSQSTHIKNFVQLFEDVQKCVANDKDNSGTRSGVTILSFAICLLLPLFY